MMQPMNDNNQSGKYLQMTSLVSFSSVNGDSLSAIGRYISAPNATPNITMNISPMIMSNGGNALSLLILTHCIANNFSPFQTLSQRNFLIHAAFALILNGEFFSI